MSESNTRAEIVEVMARAIERLNPTWKDATAEAEAALTALEAEGMAVVPGWQPIESAPRRFSPPLSPINHHAPDILGVWGRAFYSVCSWGGPSMPCWVDGNNQKVPFQPTRWMPIPEPPASPYGKAVVKEKDDE